MEQITLKDLAKELQMDRSNLRKYVVSEGITTFQIRTLASRGQKTLALAREDADKIRHGLAWRLRAGEVTAGDGFRIETVPHSPGGVHGIWFDGLVLRHGVPDKIAGILYHYCILGANTSKGTVLEEMTRDEMATLVKWLEGEA